MPPYTCLATRPLRPSPTQSQCQMSNVQCQISSSIPPHPPSNLIAILIAGSSTLPRNVGSHRITDVDGQQQGKVVSAVSSTSLYDNVASGGPGVVQGGGK